MRLGTMRFPPITDPITIALIVKPFEPRSFLGEKSPWGDQARFCCYSVVIILCEPYYQYWTQEISRQNDHGLYFWLLLEFNTVPTDAHIPPCLLSNNTWPLLTVCLWYCSVLALTSPFTPHLDFPKLPKQSGHCALSEYINEADSSSWYRSMDSL